MLQHQNITQMSTPLFRIVAPSTMQRRIELIWSWRTATLRPGNSPRPRWTSDRLSWELSRTYLMSLPSIAVRGPQVPHGR
jgi:hypothetical protein